MAAMCFLVATLNFVSAGLFFASGTDGPGLLFFLAGIIWFISGFIHGSRG